MLSVKRQGGKLEFSMACLYRVRREEALMNSELSVNFCDMFGKSIWLSELCPRNYACYVTEGRGRRGNEPRW